VLYYQLQKLKGMNGKLQEDIESLEGYTREILIFSENAKTTTNKLVQNSEKLLEMSKYLVSLQKQVVQTHNKLSSTRSLNYSGKFFQPKVNVSESEILSGNI
jgi:predicted  nucleic acid-binding Zn-ribbon protein